MFVLLSSFLLATCAWLSWSLSFWVHVKLLYRIISYTRCTLSRTQACTVPISIDDWRGKTRGPMGRPAAMTLCRYRDRGSTDDQRKFQSATDVAAISGHGLIYGPTRDYQRGLDRARSIRLHFHDDRPTVGVPRRVWCDASRFRARYADSAFWPLKYCNSQPPARLNVWVGFMGLPVASHVSDCCQPVPLSPNAMLFVTPEWDGPSPKIQKEYCQYPSNYTVSQKTSKIIFVITTSNFHQNLIIFGRKMANCLNLYEVHSFFTSPNSRQCTTVLNADVPKCYITL